MAPMEQQMKQNQQELLDKLAQLHTLVDRHVERLLEVHGKYLQCKQGCCDCCQDDLTVFEIEAEQIRRHHAALLKDQTPNDSGQCAFLDDKGGCRIYEHRPYVCRTQGLPLRWLDEHQDGRQVEMRDICPLNVLDIPVELLVEDHCWTIGPIEEALSQLQEQWDGGEYRRIALRSLFKTYAR